MKKICKNFIFLIIVITFIIPCKYFYLIAANGNVKTKETHQTMIGFGASIAWADNTLTQSLKKNEIYNYIFNDLGLDILRLQNTYRNNPNNFAPSVKEIVQKMYENSPERPKILMSSWSPPPNIKSNNNENGGNNATLKKDSTGNYMYKEFASYWINALNAYKSIGVEPEYISIQNEPNFDASWASCRFEPVESAAVAGYNKALDSVYTALEKTDFHPKLISSEVLGIGYNAFQNYAQRFNHNHVDAYAYHLYHGESDNVNDNHNPDLFKSNLSIIASSYSDKPILETEYDRGSWFNTVWLINNCLVYGNVSAYLWWELVWGSGGNPLITVGNNSFTISKYYWAFRQYSKYIGTGWKRVTADVDNDSLRLSAFISPDSSKLTLVVLNIGAQNVSINFNIQDFNVTGGLVFRTSDTENGVVIDSSYHAESTMELPAHSITTLALSGSIMNAIGNEKSVPLKFSLLQNFPNPFNPSTTIEYSIASESYVQLRVYDLLGREVETLVNKEMPVGKYTVNFNAENINSGVYFYKINVVPVDMQTGNYTETKKMILLQ